MASDLIYREDAKVFVRHACYKKINPIDYLDEVPAADVRPVVRARWEDETGYIFSVLAQRVYCPACKSYAYFYPQKTKNFCPNCGADMREMQILDTTKGERRDESSG